MGLLTGKRALIMGLANDHSIAWGIARTLAAHGAELAFTYQGEALARRVKPLAQSLNSDLVLPCDVEDIASVDATFDALEKRWGTLDFVVHAIGFSDKNELKGRYIEQTTRENFSRKAVTWPRLPPNMRMRRQNADHRGASACVDDRWAEWRRQGP